MVRILAVLALALSLGNVLTALAQEPGSWRGVYLFGMPVPADKAGQDRLLSTLRDELSLNVIQVRTYEDEARRKIFLDNNQGLWVIPQDQRLSQLSSEGAGPSAAAEVDQLTSTLARYPRLLRFYLADEPPPEKFADYGRTAQRVKAKAGIGKRGGSVTALQATGSHIGSFVAAVQPTELMVDPYYITNNIPHPSLRGDDALASRMGILPWGEEEKGYGWYLPYLQQGLNKALEEQIRPAAEAVRTAPSGTRLILVPQLHGVLYRETGMYDRDNKPHENLVLRPPSPSEIRLQYMIGLAYGATGFLAYPYGFDQDFENEPMAFPGLVGRDPSGLDHASNTDAIYGTQGVWTGYAEKWKEVAEIHRRLKGLESLMGRWKWSAAKSWTMTKGWEPVTSQTPGWKGDFVTAVTAATQSNLHQQLPQVEVGHLRDGAADILVVVNRRAAPSDHASIAVTLGGSKPWKVTNLEAPGSSRTVRPGEPFTDTYTPGYGRIFKVVPSGN